jgi:hypothetical protein
MAAELGRAGLVRFALDNGAAVRARDPRPERNPAPMPAANRGTLGFANLLIDAGRGCQRPRAGVAGHPWKRPA